MAVFMYKELTRNLEIVKTSVWVLPNIWRQVRNTKIDTNVFNKTLLNAEKCQGYSFTAFTVSELLRKNQWDGVKLPIDIDEIMKLMTLMK